MTLSNTIRIGTRGSQLALWQANETARRLGTAGFGTEIVVVRTTGDKRQDVALSSIGGKGLFVKELEEALERGEIDVAVHSLKDVPSIIPPHFELAAFLERADPRDAWLHVGGRGIADLPLGSVVATSAPRRRAQIIARHPHLRVEAIRGNVDTRINKLRAGQYDGMVLAAAGLTRLGRESEITSRFSVDEMLPAAGQGIVGIEILAANGRTREAARSINHAPSETAALCERGVLQQFGERLDCYSSVAVHATQEDGMVTIRAFLSDFEGTRSVRAMHHGREAENVVTTVAQDLIAQGALALLTDSRQPATDHA